MNPAEIMKDMQDAADEQREMDYWASQSRTATFEVTIDPDGAEVSCGANAGSWLVNSDPPLSGYGVQSPYPNEQVVVFDTLAEGIGYAVRRMIEAQEDGSDL